MLIRTCTEFLSFLVLDINIYLTNQGIVTSQSCVTSLQLMLHHCSTNWIEPDRSKLSRIFHHNIGHCIMYNIQYKPINSLCIIHTIIHRSRKVTPHRLAMALAIVQYSKFAIQISTRNTELNTSPCIVLHCCVQGTKYKNQHYNFDNIKYFLICSYTCVLHNIPGV